MNNVSLYPDSYTTKQVAKLSGLAITKVNYLCLVGLVRPSGKSQSRRGKAREYTFGDIVILRSVARFLHRGVPISELKVAFQAIRARHSEITPRSLPADLILTDGKKVYFRDKSETLETLDHDGQFAFAFVLELKSIREEVLSELDQINEAGGF